MILVKVENSFKKLENSDDIPELSAPTINDENCKEFEPEILLEDDEWFYIVVDDEHKTMITDYSEKFSNTAGLNDITKDEFSKIDLIFRELENKEIIFQKITKSKRLVEKSILRWGFKKGKPERTVIENGIELKTKNDAYFDGNDKIYFRNFRTIHGLFNGIDDYYRVANQNEIDNFKRNKIVSFTADFEIKTNNLKMLAVLEDDDGLNLSDETIKSALLNTYQSYPRQDFELDTNNNFIINSNKRLTCFLKLVLGRLYTNPITNHKMEANSAKKLN